MTMWTGALMLYLILDPVGNTPLLITLLKDTSARRRIWVIVRENLIALAVLLFFLYFGRPLLNFLGIHGPELEIAGGVVIFLISLKMIFPTRGGIMGEDEFAGEPFVVPLAIPLIAGPSAIAVVMLFTSARPDPISMSSATVAVVLAWSGSLGHLAAGTSTGAATGTPGCGGHRATHGHGALCDRRAHHVDRPGILLPGRGRTVGKNQGASGTLIVTFLLVGDPRNMRRPFALLARLLLAVGSLLSPRLVCGQDTPPAWEAPPIRSAVCVRDGRSGELIPLDAMLDQLAQADVVFLGETHDDETTHRLELAVYEGLLQRKPKQVVLAMEMFERDVQQVLDDYLAGRVDEQQFLAQSRPWANYHTAYRPLIELAKQTQGIVIASNFPRPLRTQVAMQGADALKNLKPEQASQVPRQFHPNTDAYWRRVDNAIRGHQDMMRGGGTDANSRLYSAQSLWDNSMGEACADALDKYPGHTVLHINGGFHSAYWDGTVHQLKLRKPNANIRTVAAVPTANPAVENVQGEPEADFIAFVEARATDLNEDMYSVYGRQQIKYRLHMPQQASPDRPVPLLIFLTDDGFTASDGLDLWKERLGNEVAIAVVEAPYRETQEDFGIGGRWFWPDSFASDVGGLVGAVESIWAYIARHFPVDPARVCVVGEGTGATVAASVALLG